MLLIKSAIGVHDCPPLVVFQTPPETPAAYITLASCGLIRIARVRPPILPGPSGVQVAVFGSSSKRLRGALEFSRSDTWRSSAVEKYRIPRIRFFFNDSAST